MDLYPLTRTASSMRSDLSPQAGRGDLNAGADAVERHDLGPHVGQQHEGERARADAGEFDDAKTGERAGGACSGLGGWFVEHLFSLPKETSLETS